MCASMADIHSATAEIRRGKKEEEERKKEETTKQKYNGLPYYIKKVKASHTRHRALGPELIPVYRQSACR